MALGFLKAIQTGKIIFFIFGFWQVLYGLLIILEKSGKAGRKLVSKIKRILFIAADSQINPAIICESAAKFE